MIFFEIFLSVLSILFLIVFILIGVAFFTLLERKALSFIQFRKGPNKVGLVGLPQPFSDGIKLFSSENINMIMSNNFIYYISPGISLFLSLFFWLSIPYMIMLYTLNLGVLFFISCLSLSVYLIMVIGWSSNSMYSMLGCLRSIAQTISYEVSMALILISFIFLIMSFNLFELLIYQNYIMFIFLSLPLSFSWFISMLAESHRTPFDFAEGESELVSGFNVEYGGGAFAMIFLGEYMSIMFMLMLFSVIFLGGYIFSFFFFLKIFIMLFLIIWVRGTFPRLRYDKLMYMAWKSFLPLSLNYLFFFISIKIFMLSCFI